MAQQGYVGRLSPDNNDSRYRIGATLFGVCNSGPTTATKVIDMLYNSNENEIDPILSPDSLINGLTLVVSFAYANTATNVSIQFAGQSATYTLRGAHNWTSNTILALTYYSGVWSINGYAPAGALYANSLNVKGNLVAGGSVKGSKFIGDVQVPNTNVQATLDPDVTATSHGFTSTFKVHWAQVGPLVIMESDGDIPQTPDAACHYSHGELCITFTPHATAADILPPPPVSRLSSGDPGVAVTRIAFGSAKIFAKYRRSSATTDHGQLELYCDSSSAQQPFTLAYIASV